MRAVSVSTVLFDGYPMVRAVEEIAEAGALAIEPAFIPCYVDFDEADFAEANAARLRGGIEANGLTVQAVSAHLDLSEAGSVERLRRRIGFAACLGARHLVTNAGPATGRLAVLRCLGAVIPDCEVAGVTIALENPGHGSGDLVPDRAAGAELVSQIASPFVRLNYDVGNVFTYSRETRRPEADLAGDRGEIVHAHLKDVFASPAGWRFTAIGEGSIDHAAVWARLPAACPVGIELPLRLDRSGRRDPVRRSAPLELSVLRQALAASLAFVRRLEAGGEPAPQRPIREAP